MRYCKLDAVSSTKTNETKPKFTTVKKPVETKVKKKNKAKENLDETTNTTE